MTYIRDLAEVEWWHAVSLAYDKSIPEKFNTLTVGWLGNKVLSTARFQLKP